MKAPKMKPASKSAATPNVQSTPTPTSPTPTTTTTAPSGPTKRKLPGYVYKVDTNGDLWGSLLHFRAEYHSYHNAVVIIFEMQDVHVIRHFSDHVQTRATIATLRHALNEFARFHRGRHEAAQAELYTRPQVYCYISPNMMGEDEEVLCEFRPQWDLVWWTSRLSDEDKSYRVRIYFTRTEAVALLHDLERSLADLERYGDTGSL